jgi:hypothetical protein
MSNKIEKDGQVSWIVSRMLIARDRASGEQLNLIIKIGTPYWVNENVEAACPIIIDGLYGRLPDIHGIDPFHALKTAILLVERLLEGALDKYDLYWPDGELFEM